MPIFIEAVALLKHVESHLLAARQPPLDLLDRLQRTLWYPLKFVRLGMSEKTAGATTWALLSFVLLIAITWVINHTGVAKTEAATLLLLASMILPLFLVVFAVPSVYGASGISIESIAAVVKYLQSRPITDPRDIELIKKSLKPFEDRVRSRVTILKWLVGLLWAALHIR